MYFADGGHVERSLFASKTRVGLQAWSAPVEENLPGISTSINCKCLFAADDFLNNYLTKIMKKNFLGSLLRSDLNTSIKGLTGLTELTGLTYANRRVCQIRHRVRDILSGSVHDLDLDI